MTTAAPRPQDFAEALGDLAGEEWPDEEGLRSGLGCRQTDEPAELVGELPLQLTPGGGRRLRARVHPETQHPLPEGNGSLGEIRGIHRDGGERRLGRRRFSGRDGEDGRRPDRARR